MPDLAPFQEAISRLATRQISPSTRTSAQWAAMPVDIRERSFFVSTVSYADLLGAARDGIRELLNPRTVIREGRPVTEGPNPATVRAGLKDILASMDYIPEAPGSITDLSSDPRLNLIINQNVEAAQGYGQWLQGQDNLDLYPAQELYRLEERKEPRDWITRWQEAGGELYDGRMIALKGDPVWVQISAFDVPWPPFDFNSGMWVRDVNRKEAQDLGLELTTHNISYGSTGLNSSIAQSGLSSLAPDLASVVGQFLAHLQHGIPGEPEGTF